GKTLYVTHQGFLEAFALNADGSLPDSFTSCVQGERTNLFLDAQATSGLLYVSADDIPGRIAIYRLNLDGSLPQTGCRLDNTDAAKVKTPDSLRKRLQRPKALVVVGDFIYVEQRSIHRLTAFRLQPDGTFCDKRKDANGNLVAESCGDLAYFLPTPACARRQAKKQRQQCAASETGPVLQYEDLVLYPGGETLLGTQYFKGRVDAYRLKPEPRLAGAPRVRLPKQPTRTSAAARSAPRAGAPGGPTPPAAPRPPPPRPPAPPPPPPPPPPRPPPAARAPGPPPRRAAAARTAAAPGGPTGREPVAAAVRS